MAGEPGLGIIRVTPAESELVPMGTELSCDAGFELMVSELSTASRFVVADFALLEVVLDLVWLPLLFSFAFANTLYLLLLDFDEPSCRSISNVAISNLDGR